MTEDGCYDYEGYISRVHDAFQSYRDETITKWNNKTRIAGGKVTSKVRGGVVYRGVRIVWEH